MRLRPRSHPDPAKLSVSLPSTLPPVEVRLPQLDVRTDWSQRLTAVGTPVTILIAIITLWFTHQSDQHNATLVEQGQITDRFSKAVDQLGSGKIDMEIGGAYAMSRIMRDSVADQPAVVDVLGAYVRVHSPRFPSGPPTRAAQDLQAVTSDVQVVLHILGARPNPLQRPFVDLYSTNLSGAFLPHANLHGADLSGAYLRGANLRGADLSSANLSCADLLGADLAGANLAGANLSLANHEHANLTGANQEGVVTDSGPAAGCR